MCCPFFVSYTSNDQGSSKQVNYPSLECKVECETSYPTAQPTFFPTTTNDLRRHKLLFDTNETAWARNLLSEGNDDDNGGDDDDDDNNESEVVTTEFSIDGLSLDRQHCCHGMCRSVVPTCASDYASTLCCTEEPTPSPTVARIMAEVPVTFTDRATSSWPAFEAPGFVQAFAEASGIPPSSITIPRVDVLWETTFMYASQDTLTQVQIDGYEITHLAWLESVGQIEVLGTEAEECHPPNRRLHSKFEAPQRSLLQTPIIKQVTPFDCDAHASPIQVLQIDGEDFFRIKKLDVETGVYQDVYSLDHVESGFGVNAVALFLDANDFTYTPLMAIGDGSANSVKLCAFDDTTIVCDPTPLSGGSGALANVAAVVGNNYYYGASKLNYVVKDVHTASPDFSTPPATIDTSLNAPIYDVTDLVELDSGRYAGIDFIVDGVQRAYLIGVGMSASNRDMIVYRLSDNGDYQDYAILPEINFVWGPSGEPNGGGAWGAAYTYTGGSRPRVFFSANNGWGFFEMELPLTIPDSCWNPTDGSVAAAVCDGGLPTLKYVSDSETTNKNDGMNCHPFELVLPGETRAPTPSPPPSYCITYTFRAEFTPDATRRVLAAGSTEVNENVAVIESNAFQDEMGLSTGLESGTNVFASVVYYDLVVSTESDLDPIQANGFNADMVVASNQHTDFAGSQVEASPIVIVTNSPTAAPSASPTTPEPTSHPTVPPTPPITPSPTGTEPTSAPSPSPPTHAPTASPTTPDPTATPTTPDPTAMPTTASPTASPTPAVPPTPSPTIFECCQDVPAIAQEIVCNVNTLCTVDGVEVTEPGTNATTNIFYPLLSPDGEWLFTSTTMGSSGNTGSSNADAQNSISVWRVDPTTKDLTWVSTVVGGVDTDEFALSDVGYMAISPDGTKLAAVSYLQDAISSFSFDSSTGILTLRNTLYDFKSSSGLGSIHGLDGVVSATFASQTSDDAPDIHWLFTACEDGSEIGIFNVDGDATVTNVGNRKTQTSSNNDGVGCYDATSTFVKARKLVSLAIDPVGGWMFGAFKGNDIVGVYNSVNAGCNQVLGSGAPLAQHQIVFGDASYVYFRDGFVYVIGPRLAYITVLQQQDASGAYGAGTLEMVAQYQENDGSEIGNALLRPVFMQISNDGCTVYVSQTRAEALIMLSRDTATGELAFIATLNPLQPTDASVSGFAIHNHGDLYVALQEQNALVTLADSCPDIVFPASYESNADAAIEEFGAVAWEKEGVKELEADKRRLGVVELSSLFVAACLLVLLIQLYVAELRRNTSQVIRCV